MEDNKMKKFSSLCLALVLIISSFFGCNVSATLEGVSFICGNDSEVDKLLHKLKDPEFVELFASLDESEIEKLTDTVIESRNFFDMQDDLIIFLLKCINRPDLVKLMTGEQVLADCNKRETSDSVKRVTEEYYGIFCTEPCVFCSSEPLTVAFLEVIEECPYKWARDYLREMGL